MYMLEPTITPPAICVAVGRIDSCVTQLVMGTGVCATANVATSASVKMSAIALIMIPSS